MPTLTPEQIAALSGRMLDAAVAEHVYGRIMVPVGRTIADVLYANREVPGFVESRPLYWYDLPHYSDDIAAAFAVVEALHARGCDLQLFDCRSLENYPGWYALFDLPDGHDTGSKVGVTAAEAICRAALAAASASQEKP